MRTHCELGGAEEEEAGHGGAGQICSQSAGEDEEKEEGSRLEGVCRPGSHVGGLYDHLIRFSRCVRVPVCVHHPPVSKVCC